MFQRAKVQGIGYIPILGISMLFMLARSVLQAKTLGIEEFANYSISILISSSFCVLGALGLQSIIQRELPVYLKHGRLYRSLKLIMLSVIITILLMCIFGFSAFVSYTAVARDQEYSVEVFLYGLVHGGMQQVFLILTVFSRSQLRMYRFSWEYLSRSLLVVFMGLLVSYFLNSGVLAILAEALATLVVSVFIACRVFGGYAAKVKKIFIISLLGFKKVPWSESLGLMVLMIVSFLSVNIDRWSAFFLLQKKEVALYSFFLIIVAAAQSFQSIVNSGVYPYLARSPEARVKNFSHILKLALLVFFLGFLFYIPFEYLLNYIVFKFFYEYSEMLGLLPIIYLLALIKASDFWSSYLLVLKCERYLTVVSASSILLFLILNLAVSMVVGDVNKLYILSLSALISALVAYIFLIGKSVLVRRMAE